MYNDIPMFQVGDVIVSGDIITEKFCCDLDACKGQCCIDGDAGAPVDLDEIEKLEMDLYKFQNKTIVASKSKSKSRK